MAGVKRLAIGFWLALAALQLPSCQFPDYNLSSTDGQDGGAPSAGTGGDSSTAGDAGGGTGGTGLPPLCEDGLSCEPSAPAGWLGPVALWQGESGSDPPDCPEGFAEPTDLHSEPAGAPADCTCTCTAVDQKCGESKDVKLYNDLGCDNECAAAGAQECTGVTGCSGSLISIDAARTEPTGSCEPDVQTTLLEEPAWERDARFCELDVDVDSCADEQSCFPTPTAPFASQLCVHRVVLAGRPAPACPEDYPSGPELLYSDFEDQRGCGECECDGPNGGKCNGNVLYGSSSTCTQSATYVIGSGCVEIQRPSHWEVHYVMSPGSCEVSTEPEPVGNVLPSGNYHAVCCR